jgi:hypothetical protein
MKYSKTLICIVVVFFAFLIVGCGNDNKINSSNSSVQSDNYLPTSDKILLDKPDKVYSSLEIDDIRKEKEESIAKNTLEEFKQAMTDLQKQFSYYDLTIASIKNKMIQNFWYEDNAFEWQQDMQDAIKYVDNIPEYSPIYSGISVDDISFLVLSQPLNKESQKYEDVINKISGNSNEMEFLTGINTIANNNGYYAIDIYVDDLLCLDRKIEIDGIRFTLDGSIDIEDNQFENLRIQPDDIELEEYLNKYNREINYSKELKNKSWNLILFNKKELQPYSIVIRCRTYDDEWVELKK